MKTLLNKYTNRPILIIDEQSRVPLMGHNAFGIIDRGTNMIELRPISGCNLNCVFCSVDEGKNSRTRVTDYMVETKYLTKELKKLLEYKGQDTYQIFVSGQGEPLTHPDIINLIKQVSNIKNVEKTIIQTNAILLDEELLEQLILAGLTGLSVSINSLKPETARMMSGTKEYNLQKVLEVTELAVKKKVKVMLAPVIIDGVNYDEIEDLVLYAKKIGAQIGMQNYLKYRFGRPLKKKQIPFPKFFKKLEELQKKHEIKLIMTAEHLGIHKSKQLPNPFKKGEIIQTRIKGPGRMKNNALGVAKERSMEILDCKPSVGKVVKARVITRKHNLINVKKA